MEPVTHTGFITPLPFWKDDYFGLMGGLDNKRSARKSL